MTLGTLIKDYRAKNHISMEQFAKKSGLSKAYISILERNINPVNSKTVTPSLTTIKAVAAAIEMDLDAVIACLDEDQPMVSPTSGSEHQSSCEMSSQNAEQCEPLVFLYKSLSAEHQKQVYEYAYALFSLERNPPSERNQPGL